MLAAIVGFLDVVLLAVLGIMLTDDGRDRIFKYVVVAFVLALVNFSWHLWLWDSLSFLALLPMAASTSFLLWFWCDTKLLPNLLIVGIAFGVRTMALVMVASVTGG